MSSPIAALLRPDRSAPDPGAGQQPPAAPAVTPLPQSSFAAEFIRVQFDKLLLFALIVFLHYVRAPENLQATAIGGLIYSLQSNRFRFQK